MEHVSIPSKRDFCLLHDDDESATCPEEFQSRPSGIFVYYKWEDYRLCKGKSRCFNPVQAGFLFITLEDLQILLYDIDRFNPVQAGFLFITQEIMEIKIR